MDARESRMRLMAHELSEQGLYIPRLVLHTHDTPTSSQMKPEDHHDMGVSEKEYLDLRDWQREFRDDPAVQVSVFKPTCE